MRINKKAFWFLSFTWGIGYSLIGCIVAAVLMLAGKRPKRWGWCWYFNVGRSNWGGFAMGPFFLVDSSDDRHTKNHEFGHGLQNCLYGPLMIGLVLIPSVCRYWARTFREHIGKKIKKSYDSVWFEGQASRWGDIMYEQINSY